VTVGEQIHAAAEATKWHTQSLDAFRSPYGPLGVIDRGQVAYHRPPFRAAVLPAQRLVSEVDLHTMAAGVDDALIRASWPEARAGSCWRPPAAETFPPPCFPRCERPSPSASRSCSSRGARRKTGPAYGYEGGGRMLKEMGLIFGQELPGPKAASS